MSRIETQALVLKVQPYRESSALVSMFSAKLGRFTAVFKGYRKRKGVARVEPFTVCEVSVIDRGGLATLTNFEFGHAYVLTGDRLAAGFYVMELISRGLGERQEERALFEASCTTLKRLSEGIAVVPVLRTFERFYLDTLGYGIDFGYDAGGEPISPEQDYEFIPDTGFVRRAGSQSTHSGAILQRIGAEDYTDAETARHARLIYQEAMLQIIGDKPVKSRSLLGIDSIKGAN